HAHNCVGGASNMGVGPGCETTASTGLSPLPTSLLSHCSHGGACFTAETFVNDDRDSGRRLRRWPERPSLTKVSAVKELPPCEQWLNSEVSTGDLSIVSHPEPPPIWRPNQRIREPEQLRAAAKLRSLAMTYGSVDALPWASGVRIEIAARRA